MEKQTASRKKRSITLIIMTGGLVLLLFLALILPPQEEAPVTRLPVLAYHGILGEPYYYPINVDNPWILSQAVFEEQMRYLYENGYQTITAAELYRFLQYGEALPENPVLITFDDGYLDNAVFAYPVMRQFGFTGILFMITSAIAEESGTIVAYPSLFMSFYDMEGIQGVFAFGSHTHDMHHYVYEDTPRFYVASVEEIRADLRESFGQPFLSIEAGFAYPYGRHSENAVQALREEGVPFAFTTYWGYVQQGSDRFRLPRFSIVTDITIERFSEIVSGSWAPEE